MKEIKPYNGQHDRNILLIISGLVVVATLLVRNHPFFWDTVQLASKQAHFFYENNFNSFLLPQNIDSGHPPFFGAYLAMIWKVFGKTMTASHFAMLPFLLANFYLFYKIGKYYLGNYGIAFPLICLLDPTLSAQGILVSPDIVLVTFFGLGWYAIISNQEKVLAFAVMGLAAVSMRGMMVGFALFLFAFFTKRETSDLKGHFLEKITPFLPGGVFGLVFLIFHYSNAGWIGYHPDSPWGGSFQTVGFQGFMKNVAVLFWRYFDFGRVFVYGAVLLSYLSIDIDKKPKFKELIIFTAILELVLVPSLLLHKGLLGHRYLLPIFLGINLLFCKVVFDGLNLKNRIAWFAVGCLFLLTGNLWIYPKNIAQGWDASLAHLPFYELRADLKDFLKEEDIHPGQVGTVFPEVGSFEIHELSDSKTGFVSKNFSKNDYIFYSNLMNDFSDDDLNVLENYWEEKVKFEKLGVEVILFKKPERIE